METRITGKYCPAFHIVKPGTIKTNKRAALPKILKLLDCSPIIIITGEDKNSFSNNSKIGKTETVMKILSTRLLDNDCVIKYINLQSYIDTDNLFFYSIHSVLPSFEKMLLKLPSVDLYVFDEIQHAFVKNDTQRSDFPILLNFWSKINFLYNEGRKIIFITALHPWNRAYKHFFYDPGNPVMFHFFKAPIIEFELEKTF